MRKRIRTLSLLALVPLVQEPQSAPLPQDASAAQPEASSPPSFDGSYAAGMQRVLELARAGEPLAAREIAQALLEETPVDRLRMRLASWTAGATSGLFETLRGALGWLGLRSLSGPERAEVQYAIATLSLAAADLTLARESFERAAVEAGPGLTRLDSLYGLGWLELVTGEAWRAQIPELSGQPAAPPAPASADDPPPPDPLEMARASYRAARDRFVQRLRLAADADTQANVELCLRRLRELEQIERQREEEQQEQEQQDEESESQPEESDQDGDQEPKDQEPPEESEPDEESEAEPDPNEDPQPPEGEQDPQSSEQEYQRENPEERLMTKEEMKRLLDRLREIDEKGEELRERLRGVQRVPVERDW